LGENHSNKDSMKIFPLNKGGGAERLGVVSSSLQNPPEQPPEGATTAVVAPSVPLL
jgi:hypothetical protein